MKVNQKTKDTVAEVIGTILGVGACLVITAIAMFLLLGLMNIMEH